MDMPETVLQEVEDEASIKPGKWWAGAIAGGVVGIVFLLISYIKSSPPLGVWVRMILIFLFLGGAGGVIGRNWGTKTSIFVGVWITAIPLALYLLWILVELFAPYLVNYISIPPRIWGPF